MSDLDLITVGRVNLDLYAQQVGAAFVDAEGFDAMVGGSPVNVALAAARLGLATGVLTAVGEDLVGDWVLRALERAGVDTSFVVRKQGPHTSLALRAQLAPDHPLAFYRHDPADIHVTVADASHLPIDRVAVVLVSADALARGAMVETAHAVLRRARASAATVYLDLDLREVNWPDLGAYAAAVGAALDEADVVLGTEEEFAALLGVDEHDAVVDAVRARVSPRDDGAVVLKHGVRGATLLAGGEELHVPAYRVAEASTIGAGDAFAAGLIFGRLRSLGWVGAARLASACAAITVSRFGCSDGFPERDEVLDFVERHTLEPSGRS